MPISPALPWLDVPVASYEGSGHLAFVDEQTVDCSFTCGQLPNGEIRFVCSWNLRGFSPPALSLPKLDQFKGHTLDGKTLSTEGDLLCVGYEANYSDGESRVDLSFMAPTLRVIHTESEPIPKILVFGCTNFKFLGTTGTDQGLALPLEFGKYKVVVYPAPHYKEAEERLRLGKGVQVTCEVALEVGSHLDLDDALPVMRNLCLLFSIARGTLVNWIYYNAYSEDRQQLLTVHRDSVTKPYTAMPLLDHRFPEHLAHLVKSCYDRFVELSASYSLIEVVSAFVDARGGSFLETRGLAAVSLLDVLRGRWANLHDKVYIIDQPTFEKRQAELENKISQTIQDVIPGVTKDQAGTMAKHTQELNWVTLRSGLKAMFKDLGVPYDKGELNRFLDSRNSLVHRGTYYSNSMLEEYKAILSLLDRVILKLIGYSGVYIDWQDQQPKQI